MADLRQLFLFGHVGARSDDHFLRADVKVVACAGGLLQALVRPPCSDVRFVRALVGGEARVAVNPKERFLGGAHMIRREVEHRVGDAADDGQHGLAKQCFKLRLARLKPLAVVVLGQVAQKGQRFRTEVRNSCGWRGFHDGGHLRESLVHSENLCGMRGCAKRPFSEEIQRIGEPRSSRRWQCPLGSPFSSSSSADQQKRFTHSVAHAAESQLASASATASGLRAITVR